MVVMLGCPIELEGQHQMKISIVPGDEIAR